ncbi:MAG: DHH family phosphoesterase [Saccharofermentanales bacterium]
MQPKIQKTSRGTNLMMFNSEELAKIIYDIPSTSAIGIFPHVGVDGDCLGSALALKSALIKLDRNVRVMTDEPVPKNFFFLPGIKDVTVYSSLKDIEKKDDTDAVRHEDGSTVKTAFLDFGILVDCSQASRTGKYAGIFNDSRNKIVIDHHFTSVCEVQYCYIDSSASATGELIYNLIKNLETISGKELFSYESAIYLMTAIISDTGGFRYSNTNKEAFGIAFDLFSRFPIDLEEINYQLLEKQSLTHICLRGKAYEAAQFHEDNRIVLCPITQEMLDICHATEEDVEGICSELKNIDGVTVAFVMRQRSNGDIRVNIRSSELFDSAGFASLFDGGGHMRAAGFTLKGYAMQDANELIISRCKAVLVKAEVV